MTDLVITGLHHDTARERSVVYVRWADDPEKNLGLVVPFGCSLDDVKDEAARAVMALVAELTSATVRTEERATEAALLQSMMDTGRGRNMTIPVYSSMVHSLLDSFMDEFRTRL